MATVKKIVSIYPIGQKVDAVMIFCEFTLEDFWAMQAGCMICPRTIGPCWLCAYPSWKKEKFIAREKKKCLKACLERIDRLVELEERTHDFSASNVSREEMEYQRERILLALEKHRDIAEVYLEEERVNHRKAKETADAALMAIRILIDEEKANAEEHARKAKSLRDSARATILALCGANSIAETVAWMAAERKRHAEETKAEDEDDEPSAGTGAHGSRQSCGLSYD